MTFELGYGMTQLDHVLTYHHASCDVTYYDHTTPKHYRVRFFSDLVRFTITDKHVGKAITRLIDHWTDFFNNPEYETFRSYLQLQNFQCAFEIRTDDVVGHVWDPKTTMKNNGFHKKETAFTVFQVMHSFLPCMISKPKPSECSFALVGKRGTHDEPHPDVWVYYMEIGDERVRSIAQSFTLPSDDELIFLGDWIPHKGDVLPHDILEQLNSIH